MKYPIAFDKIVINEKTISGSDEKNSNIIIGKNDYKIRYTLRYAELYGENSRVQIDIKEGNVYKMGKNNRHA